MITHQGFSNLRLRIKLVFATLLVGWIVGSTGGFYWVTRDYPPESVQVFKKYLTARAVTTFGLNHTPKGKPTDFKRWLDQMIKEQPEATASMEGKARAALWWPWPAIGAITFLVIFLNISTIGYKRV